MICNYIFQNLEVNTFVKTFTSLVGAVGVAFGVATDCQVHPDCRLATFNVNLTGTGFIISDQVMDSIHSLYQFNFNKNTVLNIE